MVEVESHCIGGWVFMSSTFRWWRDGGGPGSLAGRHVVDSEQCDVEVECMFTIELHRRLTIIRGAASATQHLFLKQPFLQSLSVRV